MSSEYGHLQDYNNSHRAFLQAFFSRPHLTYEDAKPILATILSAHERPTHVNDIDEMLFKSYIHTINAAISPLDYEIRHTIHQNDTGRTELYALVNTTSDPQTQLATSLTADEVAYVKRVIDAMFDTHAGREVFAVKSTEAISLAKVARQGRDSGVGMSNGETQGAQSQGGNASNISMPRAEAVLEQMCEGEWFERSDAGYIGLGVKGLMELKGWLRETYDDPDEGDDGKRIRSCGACKDIVTVVRCNDPKIRTKVTDIYLQGQRCSNHDCGFRLHDICVQRFFHTRNGKKCPTCGSDWTGKDCVGERAARGYTERNRRPNGGRKSDPRSRSTTIAEDDDDSG